MRAMRKLLLVLLLLSTFAFTLDKQPLQDYRARRERLAKTINGDAVLLFAATEAEGQNATSSFRQDNDFFYLTGWTEPGAALLISPAVEAKDGRPARPYTEIFFLPNHNLAQEKWTGPKLGPESPDAPKLTGFDRVAPLDAVRDELVKILPSPRATVFSDIPSYGDTSPSGGPLQWLMRANAFPNYISLQDVKPTLAKMRMVKDAGEMERIRHAAEASMAAHRAAMQAMKPGMRELDISWLMQYEFGRRGCERPAYAPIVGSGFNSTVLHYSEDEATIKDGDTVVIDVAGEYAMYASDITRTLPANGHFTPRQREIYDIVLGAQQAAIDAFQAGKFVITPSSPQSLYKVAYDYINTHGKDLHGQPLGKYFIHGLSHHIGLAVHDDADNSQLLDHGMVFSIEPGIYIPEEKLGVRIEDDFWVDDNGKLVNLTGSLPRTADEVEAAMKASATRPPKRTTSKKSQ
jgi:Xaa-Pro aminopeptidase